MKTQDSHNRTTRLANNLQALADGLPYLAEIAARRSKVMGVSGSHGTRSVAPIPISMPAFQLVHDIDLYARKLGHALNLRFGSSQSSTSLLHVASQRAVQLMAHPQADAIAVLADRYEARMFALTTPPEDHRLIGKCPKCDRWLWATDADIDGGWTVCRCGAQLNVKEVQQAHLLTCVLANTTTSQGTAAAIERLLRANGIRVRRKTISEWKRRGIIKPVAMQDGKPVYRVWDVWLALNRC